MFRIRVEQKAAFREDALRQFEEQMVAHVQRCFAANAQQVGESELRTLIRAGIQRAARYGVVDRRDVARFIDLMVVFGADFDERLGWAKAILCEGNGVNPLFKMWTLYGRAMAHAQAEIEEQTPGLPASASR